MKRIVHDSRVTEFVESQVGRIRVPCTAVGLEENGLIIAGAIYERFNGHNVFFHGCSDGTKRWATPGFIRALMIHPFVTMGAPRMTTIVAASNDEALNFDDALGFREEGRLSKAAHDGSDSVYLVIWKHQCKWLKA